MLETFVSKEEAGYRRADKRLRREIRDRLAKESAVNSAEVRVRVYRGIVTLAGVVDDRRQRQIASRIAERSFGVCFVSNELMVRRGLWETLIGERVP